MTIGNTLTDDSIENRINSPYDGLLSTIMGQPDISKRYKDICKFVPIFTRESNSNTGEDKYWFYCIKTNKKMLPTFIYKLATAFLKGYDYTGMLNRICAEQGTISEDGDKWVDKHSGYTIKMIDLNEAEEYNEEGFKILRKIGNGSFTQIAKFVLFCNWIVSEIAFAADFPCFFNS